MTEAKTFPAPATPHEQCYVDPCSVLTEWMKQEGKSCRFSTRALEAGKEAVGAERLRPGFAFNEGMDLAWALGFPQMALIVDGFPVPDTLQALYEFYEATDPVEGDSWWMKQVKTDNVYTRRGAWARIYELSPYPEGVPEEEYEDYAADVFELDDDDATRLTARTELSSFHLQRGLILSSTQLNLNKDCFLFEALLGTWPVVDALLELLESNADAPSAFDVTLALLPLTLRLTKPQHRELVERVKKWEQAATGKDRSRALPLLDPVTHAQAQKAERGKVGILYRPYLPKGQFPLVLDEAERDPNLKHNDVFIGDPSKILATVARNFNKYELGDLEEPYISYLSTVRSPELLAPLLTLATDPTHRPLVQAWLARHADWAKPHLEQLARGGRSRAAKLAKDQLGKL